MKKILMGLAILLLTACGETENEYSNHRCFLVLDNSTHQDPTLASAMNNNAPGIFCLIKTEMKAGATFFRLTNNAGQSTSSIFNAEDQRRTLLLGYNNGLIVGYGNLNIPAIFYAYDNECPNCFDPNILPMKSKPLSMSTSGLATCKVCQRTYDLNNDGIVVAGDSGRKLTRYHATTTGPFGILAVN